MSSSDSDSEAEMELKKLRDMAQADIMAIQEKHIQERKTETYVTIQVARILESEGLFIHSKSAAHCDFIGEESPYEKICDKTHGGGFDLLVLDNVNSHDKEWIKIGIEIKVHLNLTNFETALGQCISRLALGRAKEAIIFARKVSNEKIITQIRKVMGTINAPISVRIVEPFKGQTMIWNFKSRI